METERHNRAIEQLLQQLRGQGITDERVLWAIGTVPRDRFLDEPDRELAWENVALPIGAGQTISQPYIVGIMTQSLALTGTERVLEIGTGSGYQTAILGLLAAHVWSIERHEELAAVAAARLERLGFRNVTIRTGDGTLGWPEHAPYDRMIVTAGSPSVPPPMLDQLVSAGGRLVIPIGTRVDQRLVLVETRADAPVEHDLGPVRFVPLLGEGGWPEEPLAPVADD